MKKGFWYNFGSGWCHLANDNLNQMLTGAAPRIEYDPATGNWKLVIEATMFVTGEVINVWTGTKPGGTDPTGQYTKVTGLDPLMTLTIEVH